MALSVVVCSCCKRECSSYRFEFLLGDWKPVCSVCLGVLDAQNSAFVEVLSDLERSFLDDKQSLLDRWIK